MDNDFSELDKNTYDIDELDGTDIKINPDFYIHNAILKAQASLIKDDFKAGMLQFRVLVEHIESMCKAAGRTSDDYDKEINDFINSETYRTKDLQIREAILANKKLELLLKNIFSMKVLTDHLTD